MALHCLVALDLSRDMKPGRYSDGYGRSGVVTMMLDARVIPEPLLEFGSGRHIDPRVGLIEYGPLRASIFFHGQKDQPIFFDSKYSVVPQ